MPSVARAIVTPLSIIDKDLARVGLQVVAVVAAFVPGGQPVAALAALTLATLYRPKAPKAPTAEGAIKSSLPPRVSAYGRSRLYGAYVAFETGANGSAVDVFAVHDGQMDGAEAYYLGDDLVTLTGSVVNKGEDGRYRDSAVTVHHTTGAAAGAVIPAVAAALPGVWSTNHRGDGVVILATIWKAIKSKNFSEAYPQGQPMPASMVARWQRVFDWRDGSQSVADPETWKWSENPVLQVAHYKLIREKARRVPGAVLPSGTALQDAWDVFFAPTVAAWTAAANVCDEAVPLKAGGTEPRYRSCVSHRHTDEHKDVTASLLATFDGWISPRHDGALMIYAGKFHEPTVFIGPDQIVSYAWETGVNDEDAVNEIPVSYVSPAHDFLSVEGDPWIDLADISERGRIRSDPFEAQVPSASQGRRLAKRMRARAMAPARGTVTTNAGGRIVRGHRYVSLLIGEAGTTFHSGPVEITGVTRNMSSGGVTFSWVAVDPAMDAWDPATEEGNSAMEGPRVDTTGLDAPVINEVEVIDGPRLHITATSPNREDLTWYARAREQGSSIWGTDLEYSDLAAGATVSIITDVVPAGDLEVQVAYAVGDGRRSPYSATFAAAVVEEEIVYDGGDANGELP